MIHEITFKDRSSCYLHKRVENSTIPDKITFTNGVNLLIGPNACGKTTLIEILRHYTFCENVFSTDDTLQYHLDDSIDVVNDYQRATFNLRQDDNMSSDDKLKNFLNFSQTYVSMNYSKGQRMRNAMYDMFDIMFSKNTKIKPELLEREYCKSHHKDSDSFTILMDEPDQNIDVGFLNEIYNILANPRKDTQIIVSLHNTGLIYMLSKLSDVHIIEFEPGYLDKVKNFFKK